MKQTAAIFVSSLLSAVLAIFLYQYFTEPQRVVVREAIPAKYANYGDPNDQLSSVQQRKFLSSAPTNFTAAAEAVTPAVVNIKAAQGSNFDWWGHEGGIGASSGSGVLISKNGYIATNNHVVENGAKVTVTLYDKREFEAEVIGTDPSTDLALIKINGSDLPYLTLGNSDSVRVGEWVLAVGNPFNLESTVTAGIVSAKGRNINILDDQYSIESFIQTDAAVNPGNSGGALVNTNGELVGINTAIITRSGRYEGYSFAVPANLVRKVIRDLRDYGEVQRGILGVNIDPVDSRLAKQLGLAAIEGIHISNVRGDSGADEAGLKAGDVIIGINGLKTATVPALQEQVGRYRPGDLITVEYIRKGKKYETQVTLKDKSDNVELARFERRLGILDELGFELRNLTDTEERRTGVKGVKVISIYRDSRIERTNMDPGFIITKVDDTNVSSVEEILDVLDNASDKVMLEGVYENYPGEYYYAFAIE